jgi:hypothetical protein
VLNLQEIQSKSGVIIAFRDGRKIVGGTTRIITDTVAGWCGIDLVQQVSFEINTMNSLILNIEGNKYRIKHISRRHYADAVFSALALSDEELEKYRIN